ncbi:hypothetical protein [Mesorhizobium erdmanii]|uniref:hypothetical protein n=1 Tax=Mesorhizobium erdmanii TaxID=1777866 RepID=UPI000478CEBB|nr:hypothetical protein [Mesorhizobium erdmanii]
MAYAHARGQRGISGSGFSGMGEYDGPGQAGGEVGANRAIGAGRHEEALAVSLQGFCYQDLDAAKIL